ncbi:MULTISPECIES: hypothetical protein [Bacteria]|uniref:hypothetical protein n=1 Tax=Bacteria TaxID=2 RepID=UPI002E7AB65B|nr:hypothetical protein [Cetobacterium somerae]WVJ03156.1 hypothetical protein VSU16_14635 [Cetobacterium somerae]
MSQQLKKITLLSNALDVKELRKALAAIDLKNATKEELAAVQTQVNQIIQTLTVDDTSLDTLQEIITFIKANKTLLDNLAIDNILGLRTALDAKAETTALTALETNIREELTTLENDFTAAINTVNANIEKVKTDLSGVMTADKNELKTSITKETTDRTAANSEIVFGSKTKPESIPTYDETSHVIGDIVVDAEGNLCIVEDAPASQSKFPLK